METYYGMVRTPADAIKLFEACRTGHLPRVQRRLSEKERQTIRHGSVFVWDEREAGMRRWTDGKSWSASRVSGSFLTYREMEGKRGSGFGGGTRRGGAGKTPDSGRGSDEDQEEAEPDGYRYKADGLMKQSFSITTSTGQHLHLISYFARNHPIELKMPSNDPNLRGIIPAKGMYPESSLNEGASAMGRAPMQQPGYAQQHHGAPGYAPPYPPHQYWPPSPVATPPYGAHYPPGPPYQQPPLPPPPPHQYPGHPHQHPYQHHAPPHHLQYERAQLPPPHPSGPMQHRQGMPPLPPQPHHSLHHPHHPPPPNHHAQPEHHSPHAPHPPSMAPLLSPRAQHLQAQASAAVQFDPQIPSSHPPQLPALAIKHEQQNGAAHPSQTPPSRALSASPPRSSHSEPRGPPSNTGNSASNKASLSALLLPTGSESNSASPGGGNSSGGGSPRTMGWSGAASTEGLKALGKLNKNFSVPSQSSK
ncbi:camp-independent regulatory [Podospora aff. communis PSN243]|uniref:Camp-independent regulatory n=1 Tax=Podospora aff. communis PSN243 TaxID=3040156 RepID=A0AAV9GAI6_9PEZI|nr:camp-independent regulatory [Podospora aff. communis PSN243]